MTAKGLFFTFVMICYCAIGFTQVNFADDMYDAYKYDKARYYYQKAFDKDPNDLHVIQRLAHSNYRLGRYNEAKRFFKKASSLKLGANDNWLYLGRCLKFENKYYEARMAFEEYIKREDDPQGKVELAGIDLILEWAKYGYEMQAENLQEANTEFIEMGPSMYKDELSFTSDREKKDKKEKELEKLEVDPTRIYLYDQNAQEEKIREFTKVVNTKNEGEGPGNFGVYRDEHVFFYTKVKKDPSKAVNQMEIHPGQSGRKRMGSRKAL